ncbi:MAG: protein phosphatase CheZ [Proteobacteria bacterium]|nr:protein phosphatase CheZ [Pseudomonadota bacterium]
MSSMIVKPPDDEHAYEQIEAAVMETNRGRWFLAEYARRNRQADTVSVLDAIDRLQRSMSKRGGGQDALVEDIVEMARAISRAEREIREIQPDGATSLQVVSASDELTSVVAMTEHATSNILSAAERVQEYAWTMREQAGNEADCEKLDACATEIYTACGFQDLTAHRIRKVVEAVKFIDERLKAILDSLGLAEEFHADERMIAENDVKPVRKSASDIWLGEAHQAEIDETFDFFVPAAVEHHEPTMVGADLLELEAEAPVAEEAPASLPETPYDALSTEEKLRAFR